MARVADVKITPKTARRSKNQSLIDVEEVDDDFGTSAAAAGQSKGKRDEPTKYKKRDRSKSVEKSSFETETEVGAVEQETLDQFNKDLKPGVVLFGFKPVAELLEAAHIMLFQRDNLDRVCTALPDGCPEGTPTATFLLDLSKIDENQKLGVDRYGYWGRSSGHKGWYRVLSREEETIVKVAPQDRPDFLVQRLKWLHRDTGSDFSKLMYRLIDMEGRELWALICYEWFIEPIDFTPSKGLKCLEEVEQFDSFDYFNDQYDSTVRLFGLRPIVELSEAADIMLFQNQDPGRICTTVPQFCPRGTRSATFLIDTSRLTDTRELNADIYGTWGNSSGHKGFFRTTEDGHRVVKVPKLENHDFVVQRLKSMHRDTANRFTKLVYRCTDIQGQQVLFALICYHWHCEPFDFTPSSRQLAAEQRILPKVSRVPDDGDNVPATSIFSPEDPGLLNELDQQLPEGVVVYSTKTIHSMADAVITTQFMASTSDRICSVRPQFCPDGARSCTFIVDLSNVAHTHDLTCDRYGKWGNSSGHKAFFTVDFELKTVQKVDPDIEVWDVMVNRLKYMHPDTDKQFQRTIYWQSDNHGRHQFGIVCYDWKCNPFEFTPSAHGNARVNCNSYMRTAPSVLESVRKAVTQFKPMEALEAVMSETASEVPENTDVPRDIRQIRNMALRTPGAWSRRKARERRPKPDDPPCESIPPKEWKALLLKSAEISHSGQIADFPGQDDLYLVIIDRESHTVRRTEHAQYECDCQEFIFYKFVCAHSHATAALDEVMEEFMELLREKFKNDQPEPSGSGLKIIKAQKLFVYSPVNKKAKLESPPTSVEATALVGGGLQIPSQEQIDRIVIKKPQTYTQPFHNDHPFCIVFLEDFARDSETRECEHCQVVFPQVNSLMAPEDVAIAHEERVIDSKTGKYGPETGMKLIHARYSCIVPRYPYFHSELLQIDEETSHRINTRHKRHFEEQFGIDLHFVELP